MLYDIVYKQHGGVVTVWGVVSKRHEVFRQRGYNQSSTFIDDYFPMPSFRYIIPKEPCHIPTYYADENIIPRHCYAWDVWGLDQDSRRYKFENFI